MNSNPNTYVVFFHTTSEEEMLTLTSKITGLGYTIFKAGSTDFTTYSTQENITDLAKIIGGRGLVYFNNQPVSCRKRFKKKPFGAYNKKYPQFRFNDFKSDWPVTDN